MTTETKFEHPLYLNYKRNAGNEKNWLQNNYEKFPNIDKSFFLYEYELYNEKDFFDKLNSDKEFNNKWGYNKENLNNIYFYDCKKDMKLALLSDDFGNNTVGFNTEQIKDTKYFNINIIEIMINALIENYVKSKLSEEEKLNYK